MTRVSAPTASFDPTLWLAAFASVGGGYALMSGRRLALLVEGCDADDLTGMMSQIVGQPDRREAIMSAIERRSLGEVG